MANITRDGISLYYEVSGSGSPIVLTHSFLCDGSLFKFQVAALEQTHRVINVDLRGHGRSGASELPYTVYDLVDDVVAVLDHEKVESAIWMGLSIGGFLSLRAALIHPERVSALVLIDTDAGPESPWNRLKYTAMKGWLKAFGPRFIVPVVMPIMFGKTTLRSRTELCTQYYQRILNVRIKSTCAGIDAITRRDDCVARLSDISVPTLVVVGEEDKPLPLWKSRRIVDGIHGAEFVRIPEAGHLSAIENPAPVTEAVTRFLSKLQL
ncbi:MAG: alpha/beta fold hydrolase [Gammaproteobacteria bacterium]